MPEYLSPGVYVEEVSSGIKPIEGVGTSTGAFVGIAERGSTTQAQLVTSWTQFIGKYGEFTEKGILAYSVYQFFNEGGTKCYIMRAAKGAKKSKKAIPNSNLTVSASSEGKWGDNLKVTIANETPNPGETAKPSYFKITVSLKDPETEKYSEVEAFDNVTMDETKKEHIQKKITANTANWIEVGITAGTENKRPANGDQELVGGDDGQTPQKAEWISGLSGFDTIDDINIVAIPDAQGDPDVTKAGYTYCQNRKDCFFVADCRKNLDPTAALKFRNDNGFNSSYGALYYPWIKVFDPLTGGYKTVPPSGAVVGTYSHTDVVRGVHKAPAGVEEGYLNSAADVEKVITKGEHDTLNPKGVNVIRSFPGAGVVVWGARTLSNDPEWRYINVRRLMMFIEESIEEGTQWVVFEPNSPMLWGRVKRNLNAFLTNVWRGGALFGTTAEQAFFVKVDAENNPESVINAGQLIIEIGVAPVKPAEFVIIRISQKTLGK